MKRGKQIHIHLIFSNRWLYTLIIFGVLIVAGIGVYAASYAASGAGHPYTEISTCAANQILKMNSAGTAWTCGSDIDTNVPVATGLYGGCASGAGACGAYEPAYCSSKTCTCRDGYTKIQTGATIVGSLSLGSFSCMKN